MSDALHPTDRVLVDRLLDGDSEAADLFVTRFSRLVWAILVRDFSLTREQREDLYQSVFARIWEDDYRRLRAWKGDGDLAAYLAVSIRHMAIDYVRKPHHDRHNDPELEDEPATCEPDPEEIAWLEEQRALVARLLEDCPPADRRIYEMRVDCRSYEEISAELGITVNHVGVRINRLVKKLGERLADSRPLVLTAKRSKTRES